MSVLAILGILVLGLLGTVTELVLLEHYEQPTQFVPLVYCTTPPTGLERFLPTPSPL